MAGSRRSGCRLLHLLQQHKNVPLPFSSLMFFERRTQSSIKHRRLKYLLLFALRLALLLLLALAFANPFITRTVEPGGWAEVAVVQWTIRSACAR